MLYSRLPVLTAFYHIVCVFILVGYLQQSVVKEFAQDVGIVIRLLMAADEATYLRQ